MGKRRKTVNKSQAIRLYKADHPEAKPAEIAEVLANEGHDVSPQYVSTILSNQRRATGTSKTLGVSCSISDLFLAKQLISKVGGVREAHRVLDAFERLQN